MSLFKFPAVITILIFVISFGLWQGSRLALINPTGFPVGKNFMVEEGENLRSVSLHLEKERYINSALFFRAGVSFLGGDKRIQLGGYVFNEPHNLVYIVNKFVSGKADTPLISVTIPEGSTSYQVAAIIHKILPNFSVDIFGEKVYAKQADGKLFPSTYFLLPSTTEARIVEIMTTTFENRYSEAFSQDNLPSPLKNKEEVISLAAILEGEAKTENDMQIVSGILLKRLKLGMTLQVDAAPVTYKLKGLPNVPINNPGLVAISAALHPIDSGYLFYLTGKDGVMHYAKTYTEHKRNIQKYLN